VPAGFAPPASPGNRQTSRARNRSPSPAARQFLNAPRPRRSDPWFRYHAPSGESAHAYSDLSKIVFGQHAGARRRDTASHQLRLHIVPGQEGHRQVSGYLPSTPTRMPLAWMSISGTSAARQALHFNHLRPARSTSPPAMPPPGIAARSIRSDITDSQRAGVDTKW